MGTLQKQERFGRIARWCLHISEAPQEDLNFFLADQVQKIQEDSDVNQSNYVKGKDNPADDQCPNFSYKVAGNLFANSEA